MNNMKNIINRALVAKKKILFVLAAVMFCAASTSAQCSYNRTTGVIKIYKSDGSLKGNFSVSATKKVKFAQGNLQYTRESTEVAWSTGKFSFMANQWDVVETNANSYCTENYGDKTAISLFGWATSGWESDTRTADFPYYTSSSSAYYGVLATKSSSETLTDATTNGEKGDWGVFNSGNLGAGWRTLTSAEWGYLFSRTGDKASTVAGTSGCTYTKATINTDGTSVKGIILFPYGGTFAASEFTAVGSPNEKGENYTTTCTIAQWTALEGKGCVFLPAAGERDGLKVNFVGSYARYWYSTANSETTALYLFFSSGDLSDSSLPRYYGASVRLVKDVVTP